MAQLPQLPNDFLFLAHGGEAQGQGIGNEEFVVPDGVEINIYEITGNGFGFIPAALVMNYIALQHELECRNRGFPGATNIVIPDPDANAGRDPYPMYDVIKNDRYRLKLPQLPTAIYRGVDDTTPYVKTCSVYSPGDTIPNFNYNLHEETARLGLFKLSKGVGKGRQLHRVGLKLIHNSITGKRHFMPDLNHEFYQDVFNGQEREADDTGEIYYHYNGNNLIKLEELIQGIFRGGNTITIHIIACRTLNTLAQREIKEYSELLKKNCSITAPEALARNEQIINIFKKNVLDIHRSLSTHLAPLIDIFDHFPYPHLFYPQIVNGVRVADNDPEYVGGRQQMWEEVNALVIEYSERHDGVARHRTRHLGNLSPYYVVGLNPFGLPPPIDVPLSKAIKYIQENNYIGPRNDAESPPMKLPDSIRGAVKLVSNIRTEKSINKKIELLIGTTRAIEISQQLPPVPAAAAAGPMPKKSRYRGGAGSAGMPAARATRIAMLTQAIAAASAHRLTAKGQQKLDNMIAEKAGLEALKTGQPVQRATAAGSAGGPFFFNQPVQRATGSAGMPSMPRSRHRGATAAGSVGMPRGATAAGSVGTPFVFKKKNHPVRPAQRATAAGSARMPLAENDQQALADIRATQATQSDALAKQAREATAAGSVGTPFVFKKKNHPVRPAQRATAAGSARMPLAENDQQALADIRATQATQSDALAKQAREAGPVSESDRRARVLAAAERRQADAKKSDALKLSKSLDRALAAEAADQPISLEDQVSYSNLEWFLLLTGGEETSELNLKEARDYLVKTSGKGFLKNDGEEAVKLLELSPTRREWQSKLNTQVSFGGGVGKKKRSKKRSKKKKKQRSKKKKRSRKKQRSNY